MVGYFRRNLGSTEAGIKYLILGAVSTGFLVFGLAWYFGITGTFIYNETIVSHALAGQTAPPCTWPSPCCCSVQHSKSAQFPCSCGFRMYQELHSSDSFPFRSLQGSRIRPARHHPGPIRRAASRQIRRSPDGRRHPAGGQPGRHSPDKPETHDGVFFHCTGRLHSAPVYRYCGRPVGSERPVLPGCVPGHDLRRLFRPCHDPHPARERGISAFRGLGKPIPGWRWRSPSCSPPWRACR